MILWAKAEADWLAGRAAEAYETATECRSLPVGGFPSHVMVEPVRQLAALDLGIDPGPALSGVLFPNLVGANKESQAIVAMYEHPEASENCGRFLAAIRSWDRISRRNAARCAWAAGEAARRAGDTERAITILRMTEPELLAAGRRPMLRRVDASLPRARPARPRAPRGSDPAADRRAGRGARSRRAWARHARDLPPAGRQRDDGRDARAPGDAAARRADAPGGRDGPRAAAGRPPSRGAGRPTHRGERQPGRPPDVGDPAEPAPGRAVDAAVRDGRDRDRADR